MALRGPACCNLTCASLMIDILEQDGTITGSHIFACFPEVFFKRISKNGFAN